MEYIITVMLAAAVIMLAALLARKPKENTDALRSENERLKNELNQTVSQMQNNITARIENASCVQLSQLNEVTKLNSAVVQNLASTVDAKLDALRENNSKQLEAMRLTVDEKLQKTLESRLSESFKSVSERLEQVHKGLGEMQTLAQSVGDLQKIMSNVKSRGVLGEIQLSAILEDVLTPYQYEKNKVTRPGSRDMVEFAIKLPGKNDAVYIPVDAKFPVEAYNRLEQARSSSDSAAAETYSKELETAIKKSAKDIKDKYIYPPVTTDFAVMFLPTEGLYAEVVQNASMFDTLRNDYKVLVAGPSTLTALLMSLQMGFKTLTIEQRAAEVWKILKSVKTEFERFYAVLESAQKKISQAGDEVDKLVGVRTRKIMSQLDKVEGEYEAGDENNSEK